MIAESGASTKMQLSPCEALSYPNRMISRAMSLLWSHFGNTSFVRARAVHPTSLPPKKTGTTALFIEGS